MLLKAQGAASPTTSVEEDLEIVARNAGEEFTKRLNESGLSKAACEANAALRSPIRSSYSSHILLPSGLSHNIDHIANNPWPAVLTQTSRSSWSRSGRA